MCKKRDNGGFNGRLNYLRDFQALRSNSLDRLSDVSVQKYCILSQRALYLLPFKWKK